MSIGHVLNATDASTAKSSFTRLPREINQEIVKYLSDKDLASFALVEKETYYAASPPNAGHWRVRFQEQFDMTESFAIAMAADYKMRKHYFSPHVFFKLGRSPEEISCLQILRQLINEGSTHTHESPSNNLNQIWRFMKKSNFLFEAFRWVRAGDVPSKDIGHCVNPLLMTLRVLFFPWTLSFTVAKNSPDLYPLAYRRTAYRIKWSQDVVLAPAEKPLVDMYGGIDMGLMYHLANFWKFHLVINQECSLFWAWQAVEEAMVVQSGQRIWPPNTVRLDKDWKGALFHPAEYRSRSFASNKFSLDDVYTDGFYTGGDELLDLCIESTPDGVPWPAKFEEAINGLPDNEDKKCYHWWPVLKVQQQIRTAEKPMKKGHPVITKKGKGVRSGKEAYDAPLSFHLASSEDTPKEKSVEKGFVKHTSFIGTFEESCGGTKFNVAGIVHPLPPQHGTHGWQRFSMVSFLTPQTGTHENGYLDANAEDLKIYMCYEGVVLPGTSTILGRYYKGETYDDGTEDQFLDCGPFFFWNARYIVEEGDTDPADDDEEIQDEAIRVKSPDKESPDEQFEDEDEELWLAGLKELHEDQTQYWNQ